MENIKFLKELTDLNAIAGQEQSVKRYLKDNFSGYADDIMQDGLGSIIAVKKSKQVNAPRVLVTGHMDEVGFIVKSVTKEGFIKFIPIGGWWNQVMLAQQVTITSSSGKLIHGVIGSKPPHILTAEERKNPVDIDKMFIDIGVANKEEVNKLGILPGDMITPYIEFRTLANEDYLLAKAWDNRIGCAVAFEVLRQLNEDIAVSYYAAGTVQEEVGLRGAQTTSFLVKPDIAIAVDVGIANDVPNGEPEGMSLGKGPQLLLSDGGLVGHKALRNLFIEVAKENNIPYQISYLKGGSTDAGKMHLVHDGAPAISLCIPSRYIHSHTSMIHKQDYLNTVKLLLAVIKRLNPNTVSVLKYE